MAFVESFAGAGTAMAIAGYMAKTYISNRLDRDMEMLKTQLRKQEEQNRRTLDEEASVRAVVKRYSRVVLIAATDIQDRLWHLCVRQAKSTNKVLLARDDNAPMYGSWPMTKNHYLIGTMYMFSSYFCWVEVVRRNVSFLEFGSDQETIEFGLHLKRIERMLAETHLQKLSIHQISTDKPVFQLMQKEIGEGMHVSDGQVDQCMKFLDYRKSYSLIREGSEGTAQLEALLIDSMSDAKSNFCLNRLKLTGNAFADLVRFLRRVNGLGEDTTIENIALTDFKSDEFDRDWAVTLSSARSSATFG